MPNFDQCGGAVDTDQQVAVTAHKITPCPAATAPPDAIAGGNTILFRPDYTNPCAPAATADLQRVRTLAICTYIGNGADAVRNVQFQQVTS